MQIKSKEFSAINFLSVGASNLSQYQCIVTMKIYDIPLILRAYPFPYILPLLPLP